MLIKDIQRLAGEAQEHVNFTVAPQKRLAGNPQQQIDNFFTSPCQQFQCGVWQCDQGHWQVSYQEYEYCEILAGSSVIIDSEGNRLTVAVGDRFVIPAGFSGSWLVDEFCKKVYVVFEPK
ncbi:cupin domain-containing protein [Shewanella sp. NIFS-20-20]|uniref:cupin domain-containing protein n=1 Tax=Shewanella sp. NIFS-20-20 TaxID=2853806 RepID=UPI001C46E33C|nr:DUF861 domain-containing protein [Shewanella sp. NIFS-20-20]